MIKDKQQIALDFIRVYKKIKEMHLGSAKPKNREAIRREAKKIHSDPNLKS